MDECLFSLKLPKKCPKYRAGLKMSDECLSRECAICGDRITGANYHCPNCKLCVCFGCGVKIVLAEGKAIPSCPSCGSKLT